MAYYPNYVPADADRFKLMDLALRAAADDGREAFDAMRMAYILDKEYHRQDLLVVTGRIEREKGWR